MRSTENRTECGNSGLSSKNSATRSGRISAVCALQYASNAAHPRSSPTQLKYSALSTGKSVAAAARLKCVSINAASVWVRST